MNHNGFYGTVSRTEASTGSKPIAELNSRWSGASTLMMLLFLDLLRFAIVFPRRAITAMICTVKQEATFEGRSCNSGNEQKRE
jgi:hypothetical protein